VRTVRLFGSTVQYCTENIAGRKNWNGYWCKLATTTMWRRMGEGKPPLHFFQARLVSWPAGLPLPLVALTHSYPRRVVSHHRPRPHARAISQHAWEQRNLTRSIRASLSPRSMIEFGWLPARVAEIVQQIFSPVFVDRGSKSRSVVSYGSGFENKLSTTMHIKITGEIANERTPQACHRPNKINWSLVDDRRYTYGASFRSLLQCGSSIGPNAVTQTTHVVVKLVPSTGRGELDRREAMMLWTGRHTWRAARPTDNARLWVLSVARGSERCVGCSRVCRRPNPSEKKMRLERTPGFS
jgi:hypothetical protein